MIIGSPVKQTEFLFNKRSRGANKVYFYANECFFNFHSIFCSSDINGGL